MKNITLIMGTVYLLLYNIGSYFLIYEFCKGHRNISTYTLLAGFFVYNIISIYEIRKNIKKRKLDKGVIDMIEEVEAKRAMENKDLLRKISEDLKLESMLINELLQGEIDENIKQDDKRVILGDWTDEEINK